MVEPVFAPEAARPPAPSAPTGSPGRYELTFILAVPGRAVVQDAVDFAKLVHGGDSLLEVPPGTTELRITLREETGCEQTAVAHGNASRRLRDIELAIQADSFTQAASRGHDLVSQVLSRWAFLRDVAITTSAVQIVEAATQTHLWRMLVTGAVKGFSDTLGVSNRDAPTEVGGMSDETHPVVIVWMITTGFFACEPRFRCSEPVSGRGGAPARFEGRVYGVRLRPGQAAWSSGVRWPAGVQVPSGSLLRFRVGWLAVRAFEGVCPGSELAGVCVAELEGSTPTCEPTPLSANRSKPDAPAHARVGVFAGDPRPRRNPDSK